MTKATTTEAAVGYLQHLEFALVLTDVARGKNPNAGLELLERVKHIRKEVPVIVYTMSAVAKLAELTEAGRVRWWIPPASLSRWFLLT